MRKKKQKRGKNVSPREVRLQRHRSLRLKLTLFAFLVMVTAGLLTVVIYYLILRLLGQTPVMVALTVNPVFAGVVVLCACGLIATVLFAWLSKVYLRPMKQLIHATKEVRRGNFKIRVQHKELHPITEMQELMENFNEMTRELDGIELFRNNFINSFSHEFKTPIVSIRGFAREMQVEGVSEEQKLEYARIIEAESDRLARLASSILELSKLENQQIITNQTEFYLDEQIRGSILLFEKEWMEKELEILPELVELKYTCNEEMLALVWNNLIGNAIKFTEAGGTVRVSMTADDKEIAVTVSDTGIGMSGEVASHVFEKFYQGDRSHSNKGYGVGLAIVQRVVNLCGGRIEVASKEGQGSSFCVRLPR
ncbi:MAG: HAMP domain-containing histidine kinase [Ruminococcaceae bacterium]|nr:HAMP domain-containing histidine kinase [Oscillospiraceae bacterium]